MKPPASRTSSRKKFQLPISTFSREPQGAFLKLRNLLHCFIFDTPPPKSAVFFGTFDCIYHLPLRYNVAPMSRTPVFGVEIQMSSVFRASAAAILTLAVVAGCHTAPKPRADRPPLDLRDRFAPRLHPVLADTIGQYTIFADAAPLQVDGYGVVAQLPGTGSSDMPPPIRAILIERLYKDGAGSF